MSKMVWWCWAGDELRVWVWCVFVVIQKEKANQRLTFGMLLSLCINIIIAIVCFGFKIEDFQLRLFLSLQRKWPLHLRTFLLSYIVRWGDTGAKIQHKECNNAEDSLISILWRRWLRIRTSNGSLTDSCGDSEMNTSICAVTRTNGPASSVKGCSAIDYLYEDLSRKEDGSVSIYLSSKRSYHGTTWQTPPTTKHTESWTAL